MRRRCWTYQSTNNNFYKDKSEFEKQIEQTKVDKEARIRQTFYGSNGAYPGSHNLLMNGGVPDPAAMNNSMYYKPFGYQTGMRVRPSTQDRAKDKSPGHHGEALSDGNILSGIDCISNDELKERLVVAEMIMKKLYTRNKDLENAIDKAQNKLKETKRNTTQNFFKNTMEDQPDGEKTLANEQSIENDEDSEIEIGCKE